MDFAKFDKHNTFQLKPGQMKAVQAFLAAGPERLTFNLLAGQRGGKTVLSRSLIASLAHRVFDDTELAKDTATTLVFALDMRPDDFRDICDDLREHPAMDRYHLRLSGNASSSGFLKSQCFMLYGRTSSGALFEMRNYPNGIAGEFEPEDAVLLTAVDNCDWLSDDRLHRSDDAIRQVQRDCTVGYGYQIHFSSMNQKTAPLSTRIAQFRKHDFNLKLATWDLNPSVTLSGLLDYPGPDFASWNRDFACGQFNSREEAVKYKEDVANGNTTPDPYEQAAAYFRVQSAEVTSHTWRPSKDVELATDVVAKSFQDPVVAATAALSRMIGPEEQPLNGQPLPVQVLLLGSGTSSVHREVRRSPDPRWGQVEFLFPASPVAGQMYNLQGVDGIDLCIIDSAAAQELRQNPPLLEALTLCMADAVERLEEGDYGLIFELGEPGHFRHNT